MVRPARWAVPLAQPLHGAVVQRPVALQAIEEPTDRPILQPVGAQRRQQARRDRHEAFLLPFALANVQGHAGTVDVGDLQAQQFPQSQAARVFDFEDGAIAAGQSRGQQACHFLAGQDVGKNAWPLGEGKMLDHVRALQRDVVQETQGADGLIELAPRGLGVDQAQLILANVIGPENFRRLAEMAAELLHGEHVGLDGSGRRDCAVACRR